MKLNVDGQNWKKDKSRIGQEYNNQKNEDKN
jgi:hypothetical protein